jgi:hypothetical protein
MKLRDNLGSQFGREAAFRVGANMTRDGTATFGCAGRYRSRGAATETAVTPLATQYVEPIDSALKNLLSATTDLSAGELFFGFCGEQDGRACSN